MTPPLSIRARPVLTAKVDLESPLVLAEFESDWPFVTGNPVGIFALDLSRISDISSQVSVQIQSGLRLYCGKLFALLSRWEDSRALETIRVIAG